jgi:hypothetical protein
MILHFSHIGLTDGRTFMGAFRKEIEGGARRLTPRKARPTMVAATPEGISALGLAAQAASCQGVRTRGPSAVTAIVNSKWAASEPSWE